MRQPAGTGLLSVRPPFPRVVLLPLGAPRFVWCPSGGGGSVRHGLDGALDAYSAVAGFGLCAVVAANAGSKPVQACFRRLGREGAG